MTPLSSLLDRLGELTAPSREIDALIAIADDWIKLPSSDTWAKDYSEPVGTRWLIGAPKFTESIDAALTLVPEGHAPAITPTFLNEGHGYWVQISKLARYAISPLKDATSRHRSMAIALCICALRAREVP